MEKTVQTGQDNKMSHETFKEIVGKKLNGISGKISVVAENLMTGEFFAWNENMTFNPASTIKLPILCAAYYWAEKGQLNLDERIVLKDSDKVGGFGVVSEFAEGLQPTLRDLMKLMIVISDNTATNMVIEAVGFDRIKIFLEEKGLGEIRAERKMYDYDAIKRGFNNVVKARDLAKNLKGLAKGTLLAPEYCEEAIGIMLRQQCKNKIPLKVAAGWDPIARQGPIKIAHKTGEVQGVEHDIGIIYTPCCEFLFVFLSEEINSKAAIGLVSDLAQDFVNYFCVTA